MKEVVIITPADATGGFALAGVRQLQPAATDFWPTLEGTCNDSRVGVVAVDERLISDEDRERLQDLTDEWGGVLVTLPAPAGELEDGEGELQRLVRRALGYHVRLRADESS